ncbi:MAG: DUF2179 domain-containing protein [Bacillota bacterium]
MDFFRSDIFTWIVLPLLIFTARILDVSIGTLRIIYVSRGYKYLAPFLGFFEVLIWLLAITQIIQNLTNFAYYIAYAGGFAMGNFVGIFLEEKLAMGTLAVRIFTIRGARDLVERLKHAGYGVTIINAEGTTGDVKIVFTIIKRKDLQNVIKLIKEYNPKAFYSIEEVRSAIEGVFPAVKTRNRRSFYHLRKLKRKEK